MNLLAISYVLPPNLYSQAIQVGRLLYHVKARLGVVTGQVETLSLGLDAYPDFDSRLAFRLPVPYQPLLSGLLHRIAANLLPLYARTPDEFTGWVPLAEHAVNDYMAKEVFAPDVLVTFGEPMSDHLLGLRLKHRHGMPWAAHFSDPWADNPFRKRFFLANLLNRKIEREVVENADRVIFTSRETLDLVMAKYPPAWRDKARVLPHGYEPEFYGAAERRVDGPIMVRYLGNFYGHRTPMPLFKALASIHGERPEELKNVRIELVGGVPARMLNTSAYRSLPEGLVSIVPTVGYLASLTLMAESDLLLVVDAPDDVSVFLPGKLIDYLGARVPILGIVPPGASAELLSRLGGAVANPCSQSEVVAALREALSEIRVRRESQASQPWGNQEVRDGYRADTVAKHFLAILAELA